MSDRLAALAAMLDQDGELDRILDGRGPSYERAPSTPPPPPPRPFVIEPPDWEAERLEQLERERERERQERERMLAAELERVAAEDEQSYPAKKRRWQP